MRVSGCAKRQQHPGEQRRFDEPLLNLAGAFFAAPLAFARVGFEIYPAQRAGVRPFEYHERLGKQGSAVAKGLSVGRAWGRPAIPGAW